MYHMYAYSTPLPLRILLFLYIPQQDSSEYPDWVTTLYTTGSSFCSLIESLIELRLYILVISPAVSPPKFTHPHVYAVYLGSLYLCWANLIPICPILAFPFIESLCPSLLLIFNSYHPIIYNPGKCPPPPLFCLQFCSPIHTAFAHYLPHLPSHPCLNHFVSLIYPWLYLFLFTIV